MGMAGALALTLMFSQAPQAPATTGAVSGRVTIEGSNTPVAGARIVLFPNGPIGQRGSAPRIGPMRPPETLTGQDGRFAFPRIFAGPYRVDAQKTGLVSLGQSDQRTTIDVVAGRTSELTLQMQKGAVITGRIVDPSGEPMPDVRVVALRHAPATAGGAVRLFPVMSSSGPTNDIGEYRLSGLGAGEYYIAATPHGASPFGGPAVGISTPTTARTTIAATFYPGTIDQAAAMPVTVAAGAEVANISFAMQSASAFRISGIVVDENGQPVSGAMVMLMGDPRSAPMFGPSGGGQSQADGRFVIGGVTAGTYRLSASIPIMMGRGGSGGGSWVSIQGGAGSTTVVSTGGVSRGVVGGTDQPVEVTVTDADVGGVRLVARRPVQQ